MTAAVFSTITIILLLAKVFDVIAISWFWVLLPVILGSVWTASQNKKEVNEDPSSPGH